MLACLLGCGGDPVSENVKNEQKDQNIINEPLENQLPKEIEYDFPSVRVEVLDHTQEYFKEQHTTSFSHVPRKNWSSFTATKNGVLTKVLLYGKANLLESPHYGLSMSGFVRANTPESGPKFGKWSISREEIVNQLASQGLGEREAGWLTIRMRGEIPQDAGTKYFLVCNKISESKAWFGEFAFAEANPYKSGSHWLNSNHDLVMRTYVGKTDALIKSLQIETSRKDSVTSPDFLPAPISEEIMKSELNPPILLNPSANASVQEIKSSNSSNPKIVESLDTNNTQKKSLFNRLFKKEN